MACDAIPTVQGSDGSSCDPLTTTASTGVHSNLARTRKGLSLSPAREQGQCDMRATSVPLIGLLGRIDGLPRNCHARIEWRILVALHLQWKNFAKQ